MPATLERSATLEVSAEKATDELAFATEATGVLRPKDQKYSPEHHFVEHLDCGPGGADLSLANNGGLLLWDHNERRQAGEFVSARLDSDRVARGIVRWFPESAHIRAEILDGTRSNSFSVGYTWLGETKREVRDGEIHIWFRWKFLEASCLLTDPPADEKVGLYRSMKTSPLQQAFALLSGKENDSPEVSRFSLCKFIKEFPHVTGFERETCEHVRQASGHHMLWPVPLSELLPRMTRDLQASVGPSGGFSVQTDLASEVTKLAFNRSVLVNSGVEIIDGLTANYARAKVTAATPAAQTLGEVAPVTPLTILASQDDLRPCRVTAQAVISKQLLLQGPAAESTVRQTLLGAVAQALDSACLFGAGNDQPLGLLNVPGTQSLLWGGPASWGKVLEAEQGIANSNLDFGKISWATSPAARAKWKATPKIAATNYPRFILEDGLCNEHRVLSSTQLSAANLAILAMWDSIQLLFWGPSGGAVEFVFDPYTKATEGEALITAVIWVNVLATYPQALVIGADSAAQ